MKQYLRILFIFISIIYINNASALSLLCQAAKNLHNPCGANETFVGVDSTNSLGLPDCKYACASCTAADCVNKCGTVDNVVSSTLQSADINSKTCNCTCKAPLVCNISDCKCDKAGDIAYAATPAAGGCNCSCGPSAQTVCENYCQQTGLKQDGTANPSAVTFSGTTLVPHYDQCKCVLQNMTLEQAGIAACNSYCKAIGTSQLGGAILKYSGTPAPGVVTIEGNTVKISTAQCVGFCKEDPASSATICNTYVCKAPQTSSGPIAPVLEIVLPGLGATIDPNKCSCK